MNIKTILGGMGIFLLISGWAVTASVTADNKSEIKETKKELSELEKAMVKQTTMFEAQQGYNKSVAQILEELNKK